MRRRNLISLAGFNTIFDKLVVAYFFGHLQVLNYFVYNFYISDTTKAKCGDVKIQPFCLKIIVCNTYFTLLFKLTKKLFKNEDKQITVQTQIKKKQLSN